MLLIQIKIKDPLKVKSKTRTSFKTNTSMLNFDKKKPSHLQMITIILEKFDRLFCYKSLQKSFTSPATFQSIR
jgi:hypothetical protein